MAARTDCEWYHTERINYFRRPEIERIAQILDLAVQQPVDAPNAGSTGALAQDGPSARRRSFRGPLAGQLNCGSMPCDPAMCAWITVGKWPISDGRL